MKELNDEELENIDGGASKTIKLDLKKLSSDTHYLYPTKSLKQNPDGTVSYDKTRGTRRKIEKKLGVVTVTIGQSTKNYKTSKGEVVKLIHVTKFDKLEPGYMNEKILHCKLDNPKMQSLF